MTFVLLVYSVHDIRCMAVHLGKGIPPLLLFMRFLSFFPVEGFFGGNFYLIRFEGQRTECDKCDLSYWAL